MARVRAVLASMTWKSGRRRKGSAARAVVGAERVGGGEAAAVGQYPDFFPGPLQILFLFSFYFSSSS